MSELIPVSVTRHGVVVAAETLAGAIGDAPHGLTEWNEGHAVKIGEGVEPLFRVVEIVDTVEVFDLLPIFGIRVDRVRRRGVGENEDGAVLADLAIEPDHQAFEDSHASMAASSVAGAKVPSGSMNMGPPPAGASGLDAVKITVDAQTRSTKVENAERALGAVIGASERRRAPTEARARKEIGIEHQLAFVDSSKYGWKRLRAPMVLSSMSFGA